MAYGISTNATIAVNKEAVWGTPVATGAKYLRVTGFSARPEFGTTQSEEINAAHRETADLLRISSRGAGSIEGELSFGTFDPLLESLFGSEFSGSAPTITLKLGKTLVPITVQENYADLTTAFHVYRGAVVNQMSLGVQIGQSMRVSFGFVSKTPTVETASVIGTVGAANTNPVMNPLQHISLLQIGGVSATGVQSLELQIANDLVEIPQLSSPDLAAVLLGRVRVTGTIALFKQDTARLAAVLAGAPTSLAITLGETTRTYAITLPSVKFQSIEGGASGSNPLVERIAFTGLYDAADSTVKIVKAS